MKCIVFWCFLLVFGDFVSCKKKDSVATLLEKERAKHLKTQCENVSTRHIMNLWSSGDRQSLVSCLLKALPSSSDPLLYAVLGETFDKMGETVKANTLFKHISKTEGKVPRYLGKWHFAGPFVIGKAEVDGDPLEEWGGVANLTRHRWNKKVRMFTELVSGAEVELEEIEQHSAAEPVLVSPKANWNELVMALQSMGTTEWQGWLVGDFFIAENNTNVLFQCVGVNTVYIDGARDMLVADIYRRDQFW